MRGPKLTRNVALEDLPGRVQELAEVIGLAGAIKIVEQRGGIRLTVPKKAPKAQEHWLAAELTADELSKLIAYYGGETIEIDRCAKALRRMLEQQIVQEHQNGASNAALAIRHGYTERGIRKLRRRCEDRPNDQNTDLFDLLRDNT